MPPKHTWWGEQLGVPLRQLPQKPASVANLYIARYRQKGIRLSKLCSQSSRQSDCDCPLSLSITCTVKNSELSFLRHHSLFLDPLSRFSVTVGERQNFSMTDLVIRTPLVG
ncbi:hypothetical protein SAMN05216412_11167 [Nitrosospira multiformis]|uniref:Uncharacterized protein n=1 Tax=Nitrosospira multiformis TaxID=1231 RepID=A0A1I0G3C3_9PROT|nr:hypothetical protein SAMN05216412_11167 [Nitrosospira multiformis]